MAREKTMAQAHDADERPLDDAHVREMLDYERFREDALVKVRHTICECLNVEEEEVADDSSFYAELGAESIDSLDLTFRLELDFRVKIPRGEMMLQVDMFDPFTDFHNGTLTPAALGKFIEQYPYLADAVQSIEQPTPANLMDLLTPKAIVNYFTIRRREIREAGAQP